MRITIAVSSFYDWEPVPADVKVTQADISAKRVKPGTNGGWLMRVTKKLDTHTDIGLPETQIIAIIVGDMIREHTMRTRQEAVNHYLSRHVMPHHAHKNWMTGIEVHDDGPDEEMFRAAIKLHVDAGNLEPEDVEEMVKLYMNDDQGTKASLHKHFGVKEVVA